MTDLSNLTPREIAVAALLGQHYTVKRIAAELRISDRRVQILITAVAYKVGVEPGCDDKLTIAAWWREQTRSAA